MRTVSHPKGQPLQANGIRIETVTPYLQRITLSRESPSPNVWDSRQEGHPLLSEWVSLLTSGLVSTGALFRGHASHGFPFIKGFASISKRLVASEAARGLLRLSKWSAEQERPIQKGSLASPSHHDCLRLQLDDVHHQLTYTREIADFYRTHFRCLHISPRSTWRSPSTMCSAQHRH